MLLHGLQLITHRPQPLLSYLIRGTNTNASGFLVKENFLTCQLSLQL